MATLTFEGVDRLMVSMATWEKSVRPRVERALKLGAGVLQEEIRAQGKSRFKEPTGELERLVKPGKVQNGSFSSSIEVWPQGMYTGVRGSPRRAATVGFVLEYGRKNMEGTRWMFSGLLESKERINSIIAEVMAFDA